MLKAKSDSGWGIAFGDLHPFLTFTSEPCPLDGSEVTRLYGILTMSIFFKFFLFKERLQKISNND